jgi:hypothetical protein
MLILAQQVINLAAAGFAKIESMLKDTLEKLVLIHQYEKHFQSSGGRSAHLIHNTLVKFYVDVIEFALVATKHCRCNIVSM